MKGLIYPLVGVLVLVSLIIIGWYVFFVFYRIRDRRAVRSARWETFTTPCGDGTVKVGVRLVARHGHHEETIWSETVSENVRPDLGSTELATAQEEAELRAFTYNSFQKDMR